MRTLHVAFDGSGGGSLKLRGVAPIIAFCDDLTYGPINPPSRRLRDRFAAVDLLEGTAWRRHDRDRRFHAQLVVGIRRFWSATTARHTRLIVWFSRHSAPELAGLHELVWRRDAPIDVIDVGDLAESLGRVSNAQLDRLHATTHALARDEIAAYRARWAQLRTENAALRIVDNGELVSAPLDHFDPTLLACIGLDWTPSNRLHHAASSRLPGVSHRVIEGRLRALVAAGVLEAGDAVMRRAARIS